MRVAFLGNNEFSRIVLERLIKSGHFVVCVVASPDKEVGRGKKVVKSDFKNYVDSKKIPLLSFKNVSRDGEEAIRSFMPDVLVTASFGQILRENILNLAPYGVINVHASLLPKYRGSAPVNYAIINGETETGVTIMQTALSLDSGDIILSKSLDILEDENALELTNRLAYLGGEALVEALDKMESGDFTLTKQDESLATTYRKLDKNMSYINFDKSVKEIKNFVRALIPWPIARVKYNGGDILVYESKSYNNDENIDLSSFHNGDIVEASSKKGLIVKCRDGLVRLSKIQIAGGKVLEDKAFLNGRKLEIKTNLMLGESK